NAVPVGFFARRGTTKCGQWTFHPCDASPSCTRAGNAFASEDRSRNCKSCMDKPSNGSAAWVDELVQFLREQPAVTAVRMDPGAQRVSVATFGNVPVAGLEEKLADTIAAVEAKLAERQRIGV